MIRGCVLGVALALASMPGLVRAAATTPPTAAESEPPAGVDEIQAAIDRGKAAARAGDHATALVEFERAHAVQPSPRIAFNIAVCHHQLMLAAAKDEPAREHHREAAVAAYRAYLEAVPDAEDRSEVERIVVELGGEPPPRPGLVLPRVDPNDPSAAPPLQEVVIPRIDPEPVPTTATTPVPTPTTPTTATTKRPPLERELRARVGPFVTLVLPHMARLSDSQANELDDAKRAAFVPAVGVGARGAALLGRRGRMHLGAEIAAAGQPIATRSRHTLVVGHLVGTGDYALPLGRARRVELAFGGLLGFVYEQLRFRGSDTDRVLCSTGEGAAVASRLGLLLGGRIGVLVLLGKRRNHELGLRFGPALAVTGAGTRGRVADHDVGACDQTPFEQVGLPGGAGLVTMIDLGYAPRF